MLDATPKKVVERKALKINPAKTCQPIGAMYAALGIHKCLPHSHGSQGCCAFHRMQLTRHFKDPIMASTSSFTEGASVFGGGANLKMAVKNIWKLYNPDIIAVHTTCLSETIGDDLPTYISDSEVPEGKVIIHANTPSYQGSHVTGFSNMVKGIVDYLCKATAAEKNDTVNVIPGFVSPADMREIKRLFEAMNIPYTMFPDTSGVVDSPATGEFNMYPEGGAKVEDIRNAGNSSQTLALGSYASQAGAVSLEKKCKVPFKTLKTPIGLEATDELLMTLSSLTGKDIPKNIEEERGQLVDLMLDSYQYLHGKKVAIFGDPDLVIALTQFVISLGMTPKYVITGTPGEEFNRVIEKMIEDAGIEGSIVKNSADLFELQQWIKNEGVDLLMGNTHGKHIARAEDVPFVRFGFPILDRYAHHYIPTVGYKGSINLMKSMVDAILDRMDRDCADEDFELVR
ncbi:nitrogenase molybdenum-iron protein subunit beta [Clostridium polyendosporum]|uniref:Nitrogenase molybdenum-iron protein beta chain n=1 Tax=Clostridium polyendosporum TaxID=69208 RepID=A0A919VFD2_9CLOT|nr:nitrogenase molybdenum-iron protein subunit beta [Clostridium polyendosporum]GIM28022.1 nitrogenase molybdenum-iron protein subunit beta [Clostridium polyendosporum]